MTLGRHFKQAFLACALAVTMAAGAFAPANAFLDKTRFVAHLGVAYFCFHHWVWNPYHQGAFAEGAPHRTAALVKGGAALLFAVHEVRVAQHIAQVSKDPLLQKLDGGTAALVAAFGAIGTKLKSGQFDPHDIEGLNGVTTSYGQSAAAQNAPIKDVPAALPGQ